MDMLKQVIKYNCDVSDARYWGYFSICGLLLRYRDLYRSEQGLKLWANINRAEIAAWIDAKEARWPELENRDFRDITVGGKRHHPFDVDGINQGLKEQGLVYGAGYGMYMKPTFFLAELRSSRQTAGLNVLTSGNELARDLLTAPAMLQGDTVFMRLEPLMALLHFKMGELHATRNAALEDAFAEYGFGQRQIMNGILEKRLEELTHRYADLVLHHEVAEYKEDVPEWKEVLKAAGDRKTEHYLRAVKDLIADTAESGPFRRIVETRDRAGLSLSIALMEGFQRILFPEMREAYAEFIRERDWDGIEKTRKQGLERFIAERDRIMEIYRNSGGRENFSRQLKKEIALLNE